MPQWDPSRLVFIDETWASTNLTRRFGRAAVGQRLVAKVPHGVFAKLKQLLRGLAERTVSGLWSALGRLVDAFGPQECPNYFRHCGYPATWT